MDFGCRVQKDVNNRASGMKYLYLERMLFFYLFFLVIVGLVLILDLLRFNFCC